MVRYPAAGRPMTGAGGADAVLRRSLVALLRGGHAYAPLAKAVEDLPAELRGRRPDGLPYSVWELVEHMRIAHEDILRYTLDPSWTSPAWPAGYWPGPRGEVGDAGWRDTVEGLAADIDEMIALVEDPATELTAELPHGEGRTYLRQVLVAADHLAYHTGQVVAVRRALDAWPG